MGALEIEVPFAAAASSSDHSFVPYELEDVVAADVEVVVAEEETSVSVEATFAVAENSNGEVDLAESAELLFAAAEKQSSGEEDHQARPCVSQTADVPCFRETVDHQQTLAIFDE